jgi:hypothetical protein
MLGGVSLSCLCYTFKVHIFFMKLTFSTRPFVCLLAPLSPSTLCSSELCPIQYAVWINQTILGK